MIAPMRAVAAKYAGVLEALEPYLVVTPHNRGRMDERPFGLEIPHLVNPLAMASRGFLARIQALDRLQFGPRGMRSPQWIFFDGAAVTGAMFGFAARRDRLSARDAESLQLDDEATEWIPLSLYAAIPCHREGLWMGHNLASLGSRLEGWALRGLGLLTKAFALRTYRARAQCGVTQWNAGALHLHCRFGPLDLLSAYTPAHSRADSLTYLWEVSEARLLAAIGATAPEGTAAPEPPQSMAAHAWLAADDEAGMRRLQQEIEAGRRLCIPFPPEQREGFTFVPLHDLG